jgi:GNAT superfamily N-acetyltransferase
MQTIAVTTRKQWRQFFELRRRVYRNDPAVVHPLKFMERQTLDTKAHPFYQTASREAFLCYDGNNQPVGRIVAIKDDLHNDFYKDQLGFFGFYEVIESDDASKIHDSLMTAASKWLEERGCDGMRGPVNPSMKGEFGVVVEGNHIPPSVMLAHTPARYDELFTQGGFEVAKSFYAFHSTKTEHHYRSEAEWAKLDSSREKIAKRFPQLKMRTVDKGNFEETFRQINELANEVRKDDWGYVPFTDAELQFMVKSLRQVVRFDMIHVAYWEDELVGYIVNIPDVNWALRKTIGRWDWIRLPQLLFWLKRTPRTRVFLLGVKKDYRNRGVSTSLIKRLVDARLEYDEWEFSWVEEDNLRSMRAIARAAKVEKFKTFRIYEKAIQ